MQWFTHHWWVYQSLYGSVMVHCCGHSSVHKGSAIGCGDRWAVPVHAVGRSETKKIPHRTAHLLRHDVTSCQRTGNTLLSQPAESSRRSAARYGCSCRKQTLLADLATASYGYGPLLDGRKSRGARTGGRVPQNLKHDKIWGTIWTSVSHFRLCRVSKFQAPPDHSHYNAAKNLSTPHLL